MSIDNGLVAAYTLDGKGEGRALGWEEIRSWDATAGFIWIHLDFTEPFVQQWIKEESGVEAVVAEALLANETR
ncbi:MAG: zinc transporter ZntB, partial [Gammaproteobacteria bacterium]|nr:zinc transporter ZntB [Gammaproteobacteria bacterium]